MTATRTLLAAVVLGATALVAPAAHADDSDFMYGDCGFDSAEVLATSGTHSGWIGVRSVTTTGYASPRPISATVTCWIEVNGALAPSTTHSYADVAGVPGVQIGSDPVSFAADIVDDVRVCETIAYADGTTDSHCIYHDLQMPSHRQQEYIDHVFRTVDCDVACL